MESVRKPRDIKFVTTKGRNNYLVWEPNYHIKLFLDILLEIEMRRRQILINKPVFLDQSKSVKWSLMSFSMIMWNQNMEKKQNYVTWIHIAL